ncbi:AAA family ATPase [Pseudomonas sp. zfem002]|uniref:AAA family ATPase n=1 Tax=Pseudomonas sp. zfem002 TaxID=3078197 RepID=UPI00292895E1|nr:AAA family ATPase [Pseudomonas sp. zfem002]MDU9393144.1 AAA family ATPase [Pseudomonas sp. zfem002]
MDVHAMVRDWLWEQQDWLQNAAERLINQGQLAGTDLDELVTAIKSPAGRLIKKERKFAGLTEAQLQGSTLRLASINDVVGIESLLLRSPLTFGSGNLTVIYGHNGSGKSSYTRILKHISGKPRAVELKANVFLPAPVEQKCLIDFYYNETLVNSEWQVGSAPIEALQHIDIFDSDEAGHYLRTESSATYIPRVVSLFEQLASAVEQIKNRLVSEQAALVSKLPNLPLAYAQTPAGLNYKTLEKLNNTALEALLGWTEEHQKQIDNLTERLKVEDPSTAAKQKRSTKQQVQLIVQSLTQASVAYSPDNINFLRQLRQDADKKRAAAKEFAKTKDDGLEGVGSETWRAMWNAARAYSQIPYPDALFPVTDDAQCLLCQQPLAPAAQKRLQNLEDFVKGELETAAQTAEAAYKGALARLPTQQNEQQIQTQFEAGKLQHESWKSYLQKFWNRVGECRDRLLTEELIDTAQPAENSAQAVETLRSYMNDLEAQAAQFDLDAREFDRTKAQQEKLALEAKQWVSQQSQAVRDEVARLQRIKEYEGWKTLASSRRVSLKATEVAEVAVTEAYTARFNDELERLGAKRIRVELVKSKTRGGKVLHQLRLRGVVHGQNTPESVLSEGERRIISLAAFLADVADKPGSAPFIFDDPISSLDHDFEWLVACRLGELARTRQVIVFTHRLSLYGAMEDVAKKAGDTWRKQHYRSLCIESFANAAGQLADPETWNSNTSAASNILKNRLQAANKAAETGGAATYKALAQGICSDFRKLLERSVEEDLLNGVVIRHRRSVTTMNKLSPLQNMLVDELRTIDTLMTKYSFFEHSQSSETPAAIPESEELLSDIESLITWRSSMKTRRKAYEGW